MITRLAAVNQVLPLKQWLIEQISVSINMQTHTVFLLCLSKELNICALHMVSLERIQYKNHEELFFLCMIHNKMPFTSEIKNNSVLTIKLCKAHWILCCVIFLASSKQMINQVIISVLKWYQAGTGCPHPGAVWATALSWIGRCESLEHREVACRCCTLSELGCIHLWFPRSLLPP